MKLKNLAMLIIAAGVSCYAQSQPLKFNKDKKFKIVQFTDVHFKLGDPRSDAATERMNEVLDYEKPDLVIYTGDVIYAKPAIEGFKKAIEPAVLRKIPFAVTFGNHDDEFGASRGDLLEMLLTVPGNLTSTVKGISGVSNFSLPIASNDGKANAAIIYCFDSNSYSNIKGIGGYDFVQFDQVNWYVNLSEKYKKERGGDTIPALAFFHIPTPEYNSAASNESAMFLGFRKERSSSSPQLNSGLFAAFKQKGDVMATFVGHDHDNDFVALWKGVLLCYGRYTGGDTVYNNLPNGARVIEFTQGKRALRTWIHLKGNKIEQDFSFPEDFTVRKR